MRYFVIMEVEPDPNSNGFIPVGSLKGDNWISSSEVISEKKLIDKLEKVRTTGNIDLDELCE